jgi:hypothetical protein
MRLWERTLKQTELLRLKLEADLHELGMGAGFFAAAAMLGKRQRADAAAAAKKDAARKAADYAPNPHREPERPSYTSYSPKKKAPDPAAQAAARKAQADREARKTARRTAMMKCPPGKEAKMVYGKPACVDIEKPAEKPAAPKPAPAAPSRHSSRTSFIRRRM